MAKLSERYLAVMVTEEKDCEVGILEVWYSEKKYPGKPFVVFTTTDSVLQTSPGSIKINITKSLLYITTQQNNQYTFKIIQDL